MSKPLGDFPFVLVVALIGMILTFLRIGLWNLGEKRGLGYYTGGFWIDRGITWGTKFRYAFTQYLSYCLIISAIWIAITI